MKGKQADLSWGKAFQKEKVVSLFEGFRKE